MTTKRNHGDQVTFSNLNIGDEFRLQGKTAKMMKVGPKKNGVSVSMQAIYLEGKQRGIFADIQPDDKVILLFTPRSHAHSHFSA